ncbi:MAG: hypothetical protein HOO06_07590 [Bdellovibrionaceae bacterium]|jgi:hypothetical protein|nr:hypothetical protein [Pseudobdellovibrionaceae bacterium]
MNLINELFRGMTILSFFAVIQHGCSVKDMANKAANAHKNSVSYGAYSRLLSGSDESWARSETKK